MAAHSGERGYALVAAVLAVAAFAYIAFQVLAAEQGGLAIVAARNEQAKLAAAAEGGVALAIHGLAEEDRGVRWASDGRSREIQFGDVDLTVVVEDDRSKAPLNQLSDAQARVLFEGVGVSADRVEAMVAAFRDWRTQDMVVAHQFLPPPQHAIRHGPVATVGELIGLNGMTGPVLNRIAPVVTVFGEDDAPFRPGNASPLAAAAMSGQAVGDPQSLANEAAIAAQKPDEEIAATDIVGHTLTVRVTARSPGGARAARTAVVELTGDKNRPYWIRYVE